MAVTRKVNRSNGQVGAVSGKAVPILLPALSTNASEAERLQAANRAIAILRQQRAQNSAPSQAPSGQKTIAVEAAKASRLSNEIDPEEPLTTVPLQSKRAGFVRRLFPAAGFVAAGVAAGYLLAEATRSEPTPSFAPSSAPQAASLTAIPVEPEQKLEADSTPERISELQAENAELRASVTALEAETTDLMAELLQVDLIEYRQAAPEYGSALTEELQSASTLSLAEDDDFVPDISSVDNGTLDATELLLVEAGIDEPTAVVFASAQRELDLFLLDNNDSSTNYEEKQQARREIHEELVASIGMNAVINSRQALGKSSRLVVEEIDPAVRGTSGMLTGDILLSVDGTRVLDLEHLGWIESDISDANEEAGVDTSVHVLNVLRDGQVIEVQFAEPLFTLILEPKFETGSSPVGG